MRSLARASASSEPAFSIPAAGQPRQRLVADVVTQDARKAGALALGAHVSRHGKAHDAQSDDAHHRDGLLGRFAHGDPFPFDLPIMVLGRISRSGAKRRLGRTMLSCRAISCSSRVPAAAVASKTSKMVAGGKRHGRCRIAAGEPVAEEERGHCIAGAIGHRVHRQIGRDEAPGLIGGDRHEGDLARCEPEKEPRSREHKKDLWRSERAPPRPGPRDCRAAAWRAAPARRDWGSRYRPAAPAPRP